MVITSMLSLPFYFYIWSPLVFLSYTESAYSKTSLWLHFLQVNASGVNAVEGLSEELTEELREATATSDGSGDDGISSGAIAAIVIVVVVVLLALVIVLISLLVYKKKNKKIFDVYRKNQCSGDDYINDGEFAFNNKSYMTPQELSLNYTEQMTSTEPEPFKLVDQKSTDSEDNGMVEVNPNADHDDTETYL